MRRASYRFGIEWIACNDEVLEKDPKKVEGLISVSFLADLFQTTVSKVAADVLRYRQRKMPGWNQARLPDDAGEWGPDPLDAPE